MVERAESLFSEVHNAIKQIVEKKHGVLGAGAIPSESRIAALEEILEYEKTEIQVIYLAIASYAVGSSHFSGIVYRIHKKDITLLRSAI